MNYSCDDSLLACSISDPGVPCCQSSDNKGWRYLNFTLGAFTFSMFMARFFLFHLYESPKFLLSKGRQSEAVATVHGIAYKNKAKTWLTEDILNEIGGLTSAEDTSKLTTKDVILRQLDKFSTQRIAPLFGTRELGLMSKYPRACCSISLTWRSRSDMGLLGHYRDGLPPL